MDRIRGAQAPDRSTATVVGALFIIALVPFMIGGALYSPSTASADFLENASPDQTTISLGILIEFVAVLAIPLIGAFLYPVLRRFSEPLALSYVAFRALEALLLIATEAKVLSLIDLSEDHLDTTGAGSSDAVGLQAIGDGLLAEKDRLFLLYVLVFGVGALFLYTLLYRALVVPRWLSGWGFLSAAWMLIGTVLIMLDAFGDTSTGALEAIFVIPIPLNELALAIWLIVKGFAPTTASPSPDRAPSENGDRVAVGQGGTR